jgi:hypothetical protein
MDESVLVRTPGEPATESFEAFFQREYEGLVNPPAPPSP